MIFKKDALQFLKEQKDYSSDIIFCDPPYALGSKIIIKENGKVDYKKAVDFMDKWDMPTGEFWEKWFKQAFRSLKYGGHLIMYGIDRQLLLPKYYASLAGFTEKQSIYWYFISSFPKASDLSKNIDKNKGAEREVVGKTKGAGNENNPNSSIHAGKSIGGESGGLNYRSEIKNTKPSTPLAKKYDGYKYSIAPLKQTNETILIFQKPYKTGSCLHDTLKMEEGDKEITCGALDIDRNRVGTEENLKRTTGNQANNWTPGGETNYETGSDKGRFPSQTYCNSKAAEVLDRQSGVSKGNGSVGGGSGGIWTKGNTKQVGRGYNDTAGCSKILHKCDYQEHDLYIYCPKVSKRERNAGLEDKEPNGRWNKIKNNHPTVKPIKLNYKILKLFKTPNEQRILIPFAGSGSEVLGAIKAGYKDIEGCELNKDYVEIAEARIKYWSEKWKTKQLKML